MRKGWILALLWYYAGARSQLSYDSAAASTSIHFAVVMSVFARPEDPRFLMPQLTSLAGLVAQTYTDWTLVLVGDGLDANEVASVFQALDNSYVPRHKVLFRNMANELREKWLYETKPIHDCTVWCFAGVNALNTGLDVAAGLQFATHVARLDDDDQWLPHHLSMLADAYLAYPEAGFAYTQSLGVGSEPYPAHATGPPIIEPPRPCELVHATTSWDLRKAVARLRYKQQDEQLKSTRSMSSCCEKQYYEGREACPTVMAADADMWERITGLVQSQQLVALFIPQISAIYNGPSKKLQFLEDIRAGGGAASSTPRACIIHASAYIRGYLHESISSDQLTPMHVHFKEGTDPLMTAWDFCILYGEPNLTHGSCVEGIMRAYCSGMPCEAKHKLWECCTTGTTTCQQCAPRESYLKLSSVLSTYVCSNMHGNDQTQQSNCVGLIEQSRTLIYSTAATYIAVAQLSHVQQSTICSIGVLGGYSYLALLAANPTAKINIFDDQHDGYARLAFDALKQLFPLASLQLITGTSDQSVAESIIADFTCSAILAHSEKDLSLMKKVANINWHIIIQDQVGSSKAIRQAWSDAVNTKFIEKHTLMTALLLPNAAQHSTWYNTIDSDGVRLIGVRFQSSYSNVQIGQYVHTAD
eukprot:3277-Heterococcus_DN1.PRE.3